jgi:hypothetical protein
VRNNNQTGNEEKMNIEFRGRTLNPNNDGDREIGFWLFRLSMTHADGMKDLVSHRRWIAGKLNSAINRFERSEQPAQHQRRVESTPISFEQAKKRTAAAITSLL